MRHSNIAKAAAMAALQAADGPVASEIDFERMADLYSYARDRKFPLPETLARKSAELVGSDFPWPALSDAPENVQIGFTVFRAVAEALEPFHEPDPVEPVVDEAKLDPGCVLTGAPTPNTEKGDPAVTGQGEPQTETEGTTQDGQKAMEDAIAQSGGKFSEDAPATADAETKKKSK